MDSQRKGELALLILKEKLREDGLWLDSNFKRKIGSEAKVLGVSVDELAELVEILTRELVDEFFAK